jgi:hypothetical protein
MNNFTNNSAKFTERRGLYCVWVPLHKDGKAPLVSIWIDPTMTAFEQHQQSGELAGISEGTIVEETEDHIQCIAGRPTPLAACLDRLEPITARHSRSWCLRTIEEYGIGRNTSAVFSRNNFCKDSIHKSGSSVRSSRAPIKRTHGNPIGAEIAKATKAGIHRL